MLSGRGGRKLGGHNHPKKPLKADRPAKQSSSTNQQSIKLNMTENPSEQEINLKRGSPRSQDRIRRREKRIVP
jgi:hypothetical protein